MRHLIVLKKVPDEVCHQLGLGVIGDSTQARVLPLETMFMLLIQVCMNVNVFKDFGPQLCPEEPQSAFQLKALNHCVFCFFVHFF